EAEQVPVAVEDQRGAVERPVRRLVQHGRGLVEDPVLPGVDVEHMDPAAPAGSEGAGHGDVLVTSGRGASRPFWPLAARTHSCVVPDPPGACSPVALALMICARPATLPPGMPQNWADSPLTRSRPRSGSSVPPGKYDSARSFHSCSTSARSSTKPASPATESQEPASETARFTCDPLRSASA